MTKARVALRPRRSVTFVHHFGLGQFLFENRQNQRRGVMPAGV